jgi:adenylylsulfate kinase-like enzyme
VSANAPARPSSAEPAAVLVTGVYCAGKSTVVADIGALLESRGERYGVLDVDWLGWFDAGAGPQVN